MQTAHKFQKLDLCLRNVLFIFQIKRIELLVPEKKNIQIKTTTTKEDMKKEKCQQFCCVSTFFFYSTTIDNGHKYEIGCCTWKTTVLEMFHGQYPLNSYGCCCAIAIRFDVPIGLWILVHRTQHLQHGDSPSFDKWIIVSAFKCIHDNWTRPILCNTYTNGGHITIFTKAFKRIHKTQTIQNKHYANAHGLHANALRFFLSLSLRLCFDIKRCV